MEKKKSGELVIANKELALQKQEKKDRAAELAIVNKELAFQNEEKKNRAAELVIAKKELVFQNEEKENRAAELVIAKKELVFQNKEKENRAAELIIANKELAFQNDEKENRAAELVIANKEILFQNDEKKKRVKENKELEVISNAVKQASQYARSLIEASLDPFVTISPEGKITDVNEASVKVTGVPRLKLIGTDFSDYFTEPQKAREGYKQVFEKEFVSDYPLTIHHKNGRLTDVLYNASVYKDEKGNVLGVFAAARDVTSQKQASQYARSLIEASLDPFVTISPEGKITDVNEASVKVTGVPRLKLIGTDFSDYFTEPQKAREGYKQVFEKEFVSDYPLTIHHKNGRLTDVLYNASVYKDEKGNVLGVFAAARDVTSQKQASQYARSLIEASLDPFVTISPEGKITDVNEASEKVTGVPRLELIGTDFSDYFTEPQKASEGYKRVFEKEFVSDYPLTIRHKNGTLTDVLYNASVYKDSKEKVLGVFAAARDVTEQKQASQYARSLIEASLDPLVTISPEGKITDVNEASVKVTGVPRLKLIGTDFSDYFTEPQKASKGYKRVFEKEYVSDYPLTIRHKNGKLTDVLYNASLYKDEKGNVLGVFAAARDVTAKKAKELIIANKKLVLQNKEKEKQASVLEIANAELKFQNQEKEKNAEKLRFVNKELKQAEDDIRKLNDELEQKVVERTAQLEAVNKELGSFSYSVSHDLRAPIRAINGYSKILVDDYAEKFDAEGEKVLHSIMHNSKRMGNLIDDLLAFSKLGRKQVTVLDINMINNVNQVIEEILFDETENLPVITIKLLPAAKGDQSLIKQVWINLISNAIKYSKYKPITNIEIGAFKKDNFNVYFVKDEGAGFDMQYYDKLFGVFQRLHSQEEFEGTGIGLAIVQKIVNRHGGTVWAKSKINEGSCFYFSLPAINN
jgi:PAS domain S-box-containing protein